MKITKLGKYILNRDLTVSDGNSVKTLLEGTTLNITQIDADNNKVISQELGDWHYNDLPVK